MSAEQPAFPTKKFRVADAKNDILTGWVVTAGAFLGAILVIIIPAREGASPGGRLFLVGMALTGAGKGMNMISRAKRRLKEVQRENKEPNQPPEPTAASGRGSS